MKQIPISVVVPDGSMQPVVMDLLAKAGMPVKVSKRSKEGKIEGGWIDKFFFQRPQEIPLYLNAGNFDLAIVGEDWIANWGFKFPVLLKLPIGQSGNRKPVKIVLAVSQDSGLTLLQNFPQGSEVATEYVELAKRYFANRCRSDIRVMPSYGNTEQKIRFGATAIIDVTETGESLRENNLVIIDEIMESNTVLVANPASLNNEYIKPNMDLFTELVKGAFEASGYVLVVSNVPEKVLKKVSRILGGLKGPSCSPLIGKGKGRFALQSVIPREKEQEVVRNLRQIGVTDIFVIRDIPLIMS